MLQHARNDKGAHEIALIVHIQAFT